MKKIALVLSGCGVFDGSEIQEAVLTMLHIAKAGASYECFAPDIPQMHVLDHTTGEEMQETRNVMIEASRISRGNIKPVSQLHAKDFDAVILPGGFGAAKNLSDFAVNGAKCEVDASTLNALKEFSTLKKPAGYMCIAPAIVAHVYGSGSKVTIGNDSETASAIEQMGASHCECAVDDISYDEANNLVTTPAYMLANSISEADAGISKLVNKVMQLCA
ncbi:isoprenoid biosynthesis glyoxalase ElbB [Glaciecola sp. 2405UD65-10]|uniref:isoprenoid biosynthesis glyoxalase ElbB n=1 Tax=Glaciecola sp. 2405UD65-10 TaxID=3397244 RepID=UPI003B594A99